MRLPSAASLSVAAGPGRFRRWLRSDMRVLRWVFLALYLAIAGGLLAQLFFASGLLGLFLVAAALVVAEVLMILGTGTIHLCRPIRRRRLVLPVFAAAFMLTVLVAGFFTAMTELFYLDKKDWPWAAIFFLTLGASWVGWGVLLWSHVAARPRYTVLSRLTGLLFAGSLAELLATVPSHLIVSRRPGCLVGIGTMLGIMAGLGVMLASFGPAIVLLFLRPRHRAEIGADGHPHCPACGYDLHATPDRCPECGLLLGEPSSPQDTRLDRSVET
jgi:hypothetical protein